MGKSRMWESNQEAFSSTVTDMTATITSYHHKAIENSKNIFKPLQAGKNIHG